MTSRTSVPLGRLVAHRIVLFSIVAMVAQLAIVFMHYYGDDAELGRLAIERETAALAKGLSHAAGSVQFHLPPAIGERYSSPATNQFVRIRTRSGDVLYSNCDHECAEHFLPLDVHPPSFWIREIAPDKPLTIAGGRTFQIGTEAVLVEIAVLGDPHGLVWGVLGHEVLDHMLVPMSLILIVVLGASLLSIQKALAPVKEAARVADGMDPMNAGARLETRGMPREIEQLAGAVNRAFARLSELIRAQKLVTSAMAHEIRTPLAVIKLELERIDHPRARKAETDLDELVRFVEQLTALARLEAVDRGTFQEIHLGRMAADAVASLAPWVFRHVHTIEVKECEDVAVLGLEGLLRDALRNLVENAVKHTPEDTRITVSTGPGPILSVADNGVGMKCDGKGQGGLECVKRGGRIGIGLDIVRRIAAIHGAQFDIEGTAGEGTIARLQFAAAPQP